MAEAQKGLRGVVVAQSELSWIDGEKGLLVYRGYDINDLARYSSFGEVTYLLLQGELPTGDQLAQFEEEREANRALSQAVVEAVDRAAAEGAAPMEMLRTAVSAAAYDDPDKGANDPGANYRKAVRLIAKIPPIVSRYQRRREGKEPVEPDPDLDWAVNFLYMLRGEAPSEEHAKTFDVAMILHADHEMNASTFTARVIAATLSDMHSAIVGAIGALKGPLHGGANEWVMDTLERIGDGDGVEDELRALLAQGEKIPGFGHAVYKTMDPRAAILKEHSRRLSEEDGAEPRWFAMTERMERFMLAEKGLWPNVDLYSASVYRYLGIPTDLFTTVFAASRVSGWAAHVIEQLHDNKIIRPASKYVGPRHREFPALSQRS